MDIKMYPKNLLETAWAKDMELFSPDAELPPLCLRCGNPLDGQLAVNALSRYANVYICQMCGTDEALLDAYAKPRVLTDWHAIAAGRLNSLPMDRLSVLTPFCSFEDVYEDTASTYWFPWEHPETEVCYSRSDYDGHQWWTTWNRCQKEQTAPQLTKEIDEFQSSLMRMDEFRTLNTLRRLCKFAETTERPNEYNLYSETEHFYIWLRLITREKDYNLYVHYYQKKEPNKGQA